MTSDDFDFDTWFDTLSLLVLDGAGVEFQDQDSVRNDYETGRNVHDVADEIIAEYGGEE
ncbi:hypothetical protein [Malikia spinosa]|uniref:hypothetical protein n=1 Tax=Malikia spinosa TaxID=86180 RepID=UPI002684F1C5